MAQVTPATNDPADIEAACVAQQLLDWHAKQRSLRLLDEMLYGYSIVDEYGIRLDPGRIVP